MHPGERELLIDWLEEQPKVVQAVVAARAALRVLPYVLRDAGNDEVALTAFRQAIIATAFARTGSAELVEVARSSRRRNNLALDERARSAVHASNAAIRVVASDEPAARYAVLASSAAEDEALSASLADREAILNGRSSNEVLESPLWPQSRREASRPDTPYSTLELDPKWAFWRDWIAGMHEGSPTEWDLQTTIALLPDHEWAQGPKHIAGRIVEIAGQRLRGATSIAETVQFNAAQERFDVAPTEILQSEVLRIARERVEDSLNDALALARGQHLREESVEAFVLRRVFQRYADDPQRIEMDFSDMAGLIVRQIASGEYPDSPELQQLVGALVAASAEICAAHPMVRETRERLDGQVELEPLEKVQQERLAQALPVLRAISTMRLREGFDEDIAELVSDVILPQETVPPTSGPQSRRPRKSVVRRLAFRVSSVAVNLREVVDDIEASAGFKAATIISTIVGIVTLLIGIIF